MKKLNVAFHKMLFCLMSVILMINMTAQPVLAAPEESGAPASRSQQVFLDHYQLTDEKIVPGSEFTLKLFLKNTGSKEAKHVIVDVLNPRGVLPVYATVSQAIVNVPAEGTAEVAFAYNALEKIDTPVLDFQVSIRENSLQNVTILQTLVGTKSPFDVIATFVPARTLVKENVNCSMTFKYLGTETADKVRARMDVNGHPVHTVDIGVLPKETTKTQSLFTQFNTAGKYVIELYLDYQDAAGEEKSVLVGTSLIEVMENHGFPVSPDQSDLEAQMENANNLSHQIENTKVLIVSGILIVLIFLIIVFLIKKKK